MAITRSQQAKQLLAQGGRIGLKGGADAATVGFDKSYDRRERTKDRPRSVDISPTGSVTTSRDDPRPAFEMIGGERVNVGDTLGRQRALERSNIFQSPKRFQGIRSLASKFNPLSFILGLINPGLGIASRFFTQQAPETLQTFKDSPTLVDFFKNMRNRNKVDTTGLSGVNPTFQDDLGNELLMSTKASPNMILPRRKPDMLGLLEVPGIPITPFQEDVIEDQNEDEQLGDIRDIMAADGGMIGGGIMDAAGRQNYFLGKLVKKATRAVKKIVKSPVGRLGLFAAASAIPFGASKASLFQRFIDLDKGKRMLAGAGLLSAAPFIIGQEEEEQPAGFTGSVGGQIDPKAYTDPFGVLYGAFKAEGGSMKDEPVAKRTMPLLDMGGQEMDLRAEGGFVPIGRMEKADDVPARLSKNEFVFTADAVRNAGDGDVDKGAEVMYNMMKNLEAGGDVSEESQGLDGARNMFQTSKRLEEVL